MSGTTTVLGDPGILAGIGTVAIDGTLYNCSDVTYTCSDIEYEALYGYNGFHGRKATYVTSFIAFKVRDDSTINTGTFNRLTNAEVVVSLANGKTVSGHSMCCMKAVEVDANDAIMDLRFEGPSVSEFWPVSTKKLIFSPPLEHDGTKADAIVLVEPTALQVVTAEKAGVAEIGVHATRVRDTALVGAVGHLPIDLVRRMPARQFKEAAAFVNGFSVAPKSPLVNLDPELAIDLDARIEKAGRIVDRLELREPTTGEIEEAQRKLASGVNPATLRESQIHLVALVAEMPRTIIEMLPIHVLDEASRYLLGFT